MLPAGSCITDFISLEGRDRVLVSPRRAVDRVFCESGRFRCRRRIAGGRARVRTASYMEARATVRRDRQLAAFRARLLAVLNAGSKHACVRQAARASC